VLDPLHAFILIEIVHIHAAVVEAAPVSMTNFSAASTGLGLVV
jgi:hypothetical protein